MTPGQQIRAAGMIYVFGIPLVIAVAIGWWVVASAMEASAYNNATGASVSTWDAMWIELRVQGSPK